jgi:uncharacterized RDD family membrane protein YckC
VDKSQSEVPAMSKLYVQMGDKIKGPYTLAELRTLRDRGQLASFHRISFDKKSWKSVSLLDNFEEKKRTPLEAEPEPLPVQSKQANNPRDSIPLAAEVNDVPRWHFVDRNGQEEGPVPLAVISSLCDRKIIGPETLVWASTLEGWTPLQETELRRYLARTTSPRSPSRDESPSAKSLGDILASPGRRAAAFSLDFVFNMFVLLAGILLAFIVMLLFFGSVNTDGITDEEVTLLSGAGGMLSICCVVFSFFAFQIFQIILLCSTGQTLGKRLIGIRIVTLRSGQIPSFGAVYLLRSFLPGMVYSLPIIGFVSLLVDVLFIFREDHRCVHDYLAGTKVVVTEKN